MNLSIIDDHKLIGEILKASLLQCDFIDAIHIYDDFEKLFAHIDVIPTDFLITDILMPNMSGIDIIKRLRKTKKKSALKILVLSSVIDVNLIKQVIQEGANGYLGKDASMAELTKAIKFINESENKLYIGESIKDTLFQAQLFEMVNFDLSPREKELLQLVCNGKTVKEAAADLGLSHNTVQSYMKQLMRKLEVNRTPDLILKAINYGLFHPAYAG